jgi:hypothetical protein
MRPEHIPVDAYRLLARLRQGSIPTPGGNPDDDAAVDFLLTWNLATETADNHLAITDAGREVGRLMRKAP